MIYMDNSATSYPKPYSVINETERCISEYFANPGRGTSRDALKSSEMLYSARETLAALVGTCPENIVFTYNATYALNMAIQGVLCQGMRVAYDKFAHNSVLRPIYALEKKGVKATALDTHPTRDSVLISDLERIAPDVDALVLTHTSNVIGKQLPVKRISEICHKNGVLLIVDASQGLGSCEINMREMGIDILASSGHKGLYGIMGTGFLAVREGGKFNIEPTITGGSGIFSKQREMPEELPERLEAGTVGLPGIVSMKAGAEYILKVGAEEIGSKERRLRSVLVEGLSVVKGVKLYNADVNAKSIVLFNVNGMSVYQAGEMLDREGIILRTGFHCAPLAHSLICDSEEYDGALRLSVGYFNTLSQCKRVLKAISNIVKSNS